MKHKTGRHPPFGRGRLRTGWQPLRVGWDWLCVRFRTNQPKRYLCDDDKRTPERSDRAVLFICGWLLPADGAIPVFQVSREQVGTGQSILLVYVFLRLDERPAGGRFGHFVLEAKPVVQPDGAHCHADALSAVSGCAAGPRSRHWY